ncbi:MGH1-like glycoside hydrolase domain-containing protein [Flavobacterium sp.]
MSKEKERLKEDASNKINWKKWGPYLSERQWGTVREDYSKEGFAWEYTTHDMARSKTYRWGEDGIAGLSDNQQRICFSVALWNKKDPIIKERLFGLTSSEGNHGEDVKELYYYLDNTPTHSYQKMLYKYPQSAFPYETLLHENKKRTKLDPEFELIDTGIFNEDNYFDIFIEYAKNAPDDILIKITICNRSKKDVSLNVLPQIWFRNTWDWGYDDYKPRLFSDKKNEINIDHKDLGEMILHFENNKELLFCENETNSELFYGIKGNDRFYKDGINNFIIFGNEAEVNPNKKGTKVAINYDLSINAGATETIRLRLEPSGMENPFGEFEKIFEARKNDADEFYNALQKNISSDEERNIQRQALAGMLWGKQFYYYDVTKWLNGDPAQPKPPSEREAGRNCNWKHLNNADIISMPDKWEFPWYASWDVAFHTIAFALIDTTFAKNQLELFVREWYMHPNGQLPAYEWEFNDTNPPVHAYAAWRVYKIDQKKNNGIGDTKFLETVFQKLIINFTWWVNRKDNEDNNLFEGGFLGLDNIGVFDRNSVLPGGSYIEQSDGTSWMAMYSLNMMRIALELAKTNDVYEDMATKFFEHFLYIANAMSQMGEHNEGLWDEEDQFYYDMLKLPDNTCVTLKVRSVVGLIPMFAVEVLDQELIDMPGFSRRLRWFLENRPELANLVSYWREKNQEDRHLLSMLRGHRFKKILKRMLDENEFLSPYGIRALSKYHEQHPFELNMMGTKFSVNYEPGESETVLFGGNSNWRGPVWMPINFLIVESLQRFHYFYGDEFKVECPTGSGNLLTLKEISEELSRRLLQIFLKDKNGNRPVAGSNEKMQRDPNFNNYILFHEYFHGDSGKGLGASHQTGWSGLIAKIIQPRGKEIDGNGDHKSETAI